MKRRKPSPDPPSTYLWLKLEVNPGDKDNLQCIGKGQLHHAIPKSAQNPQLSEMNMWGKSCTVQGFAHCAMRRVTWLAQQSHLVRTEFKPRIGIQLQLNWPAQGRNYFRYIYIFFPFSCFRLIMIMAHKLLQDMCWQVFLVMRSSLNYQILV